MVWLLASCVIIAAYGQFSAFAAFPIILVVVLSVRRWRSKAAVAGVALAAACFVRGGLDYGSLKADGERLVEAGAANRTLEGWVCGFPEYGPARVRFPFRTTLGGRTVTVLASGAVFGVNYGDSLTLSGRLSAGRSDRAGYLLSKGAAGYFRVRRGGVLGWRKAASGSSLYSAAGWAHESARCRLARGLGTRCGLPLGLLIGDRGWVGRVVEGAFVKLGITHLLALSGMNLGMIAAAALLVVRRIGVRRNLALFVVVTAYVAVVGDVVSLYRAYVMAVWFILAASLERPLRPIDVLGRAVLFLLLLAPHLAHSVGFQLSAVATLAVFLCIRRYHHRTPVGKLRRAGSFAVSTLRVSLYVQAFVLPLQLRYFGGVSAAGPLATLLFIPVVGLLLFASWAAVLVVWAAPPLATVVFDGLAYLAGGTEWLVLLASSAAPALVELPAPNIVLYYGAQAVFWSGRGKWRIGTAVLLIAVSFLLR